MPNWKKMKMKWSMNRTKDKEKLKLILKTVSEANLLKELKDI
jgi:hypothetical protein